MTAQTFAGDERTVDAVERCLGRISEAATKLGTVAEEIAPGPPWKDIRSFGNVLLHGYDIIDVTAIWRIVDEDLATLLEACTRAQVRLQASEMKPD